MSKNEEKERTNSKGPKKDNKPMKVNKKPGNVNKSPFREGGKPDDISNAFPNFSALTEDERVVFFEALTTARKNVEKRGVLTRQRFGTVHDEYLKYFNQDEGEKKKCSANERDTPSLKSSLTIHDGNASSCSDQSTLKIYNRNPSDGGPGLPTSLFEKALVTSQKDLLLKTKKPESWEGCESLIQQNASQMVDLYMRKKRKNQAKCEPGVQLVNKKPEKKTDKEMPDEPKKENIEAGKKRKKRTPIKTIPKVRNTPKFNALSTEEKDIFFRTLQEARDSVVKKNPEKKNEILPLNAIVRNYRNNREATAVFATPQQLRRGEDGRKNLRVKVTLTSGDNERLNRTKSQVFSDTVREATEKRHKSAESLHAEGKELNEKNEMRSESSLSKKEKSSRTSIEILKSSSLTLKKGKVTEKKIKKCEETKKLSLKKKKKTSEKQEKLPRPASSLIIFEPKITDSLKVNISNSSLAEKKNKIKSIKKETLGKKLTKNEKQSRQDKKQTIKKKTKKKEERHDGQKLIRTGSFFPCKMKERDKQVEKVTDGVVLAEKCEITEVQENVNKENSAFATDQPSGSNCKKDSPETENAWAETRNYEESDDEEGEQMKCEPQLERQENCEETMEEEPKTDLEMEREEKTSAKEENSWESLEGLLTKITHSISNFSLEGTALPDLEEDRSCEHEKVKEESERKGQLIGVNLNEITVEANAQGEVFGGKNFEEEKKTASEIASCKVMLMDNNVVENIRNLIYYLEAKVQKDGHLENEYLQLVVDYVDYLSKVLESLILREERNPMQVRDTYTAAEVHLKFDDKEAQEVKKAADSKTDFFPRSISDQDFRRKHAAVNKKAKEEKLKENISDKKLEEKPAMVDSGSSSESEGETHFAPLNVDDKKVLSTKIRLLQDLLKQRAEFVEGSISDFKIVHNPEAKDFVPVEKPPAIQVLTDEDEENVQQDNKMKFFKVLLRCCSCGKKKTEDDGVFENLKGEAVRVEAYEEKIDPASATLNPSTMEVLKAAERKKIIEKYYSQD